MNKLTSAALAALIPLSLIQVAWAADTLIGGTGKYKGISGTAPYTISPLPAPGQGLGAIALEHKVSWQFK
ncbi:hypothetical protein [Polaromonas naphthalenivorans]|nr:hypothetical protein [Polaromonas naphthalenivorans]